MINREMLRQAISQIATNNIGTLQSVNGNKATVVINEQVYPDMMLLEVFTCEEYKGGTGTCYPFDWQDHIGSKVLVTLIDGDHSNGVVVGVIK